ncbi:hypothetical protein GCM10010912_25610 [Paenibacillus albidus]|uniref:Uncharacterized protein n=1 Tax=Paenibacillus albidus TaxID=2041023 RepID=A0A917FI61_9BACL|nr:hypothetical protein GCM10010912_25610 [Paenibacillus albidus]
MHSLQQLSRTSPGLLYMLTPHAAATTGWKPSIIWANRTWTGAYAIMKPYSMKKGDAREAA